MIDLRAYCRLLYLNGMFDWTAVRCCSNRRDEIREERNSVWKRCKYINVDSAY